MNHKKINQYLGERNLELKEGFPDALSFLSKAYKKKQGIPLLDHVYESIGTRKQDISWWRNNLISTQTKKIANMR